MLSLNITDVKGFMSKLLKDGTFDNFALHRLTIKNFACFEIYKETDKPAPPWAAIRPYAYEIVKADKTAPPQAIKIVLASQNDGLGVDDGVALFTNIIFEDGKTTITTGVAQKNFSLDKSTQIRWDEHILKFLNDNDVHYTNNLI